MKRYLLYFVAAFSLCACSSSDIEPENKGSLVGSVSDATTGEPIASANVSLTPSGKQTVTGSDGNYSFVDINAGEYMVEIAKDGYNTTYSSVIVNSGEITQKHMQLERIPAVITADRNLLDFGESLTTMSFTIVNRGYTQMTYSIEYGNCSWIKVNPAEEAIKPGATATIVVTIDRSLLASGENEAILVVRSLNGGGNTEIRVIAIGEYRAQSAVNTLPASDISNNSATLNGEIINEGAPKYTERGFVWSTTQEMTLTNCVGTISVAVNSQKSFTCRIENLSPNQTYYARAYCKQNGQIIYGNVVAFSMSSLTTSLSTSAVTAITAVSATLNASISVAGNPPYTERGFCYGTEPEPTIANNRNKVTGSGIGNYSLNVTGLTYPTTYYVRAYAIQSGVPVYGNIVSFTTSVSEVNIITSAATNITATSATLNATISNAGQPAYTERGFCVAIDHEPTISDNRNRVSGTGTGTFNLTLTNLQYPATYYVKAYAIQGGKPVYGNLIMFSTSGSQTQVVTSTADKITTNSARLNGIINSAGDPTYTVRGFVYSATSSNPTYADSKVFENASWPGPYNKEITGLDEGATYFFRAFAMQAGEPIYGSTQMFTTNASPRVQTNQVTNIHLNDMGLGIGMDFSATLNASILFAGQPAYTERGFAWGTAQNPTVGDGHKIVVSGKGTGSYSTTVNNFPTYSTIYVRAYVKTSAGYTYGEPVSFSTYY